MKRKGTYTTKHEGLQVPVEIIDERHLFGRHEMLIEPKGQKPFWVTAEKVVEQ